MKRLSVYPLIFGLLCFVSIQQALAGQNESQDQKLYCEEFCWDYPDVPGCYGTCVSINNKKEWDPVANCQMFRLMFKQQGMSFDYGTCISNWANKFKHVELPPLLPPGE